MKYQEMDKGVCGVLKKVMIMVTSEFKLDKEVVEEGKSQAHHLISVFKAQPFSPLKCVLSETHKSSQTVCLGHTAKKSLQVPRLCLCPDCLSPPSPFSESTLRGQGHRTRAIRRQGGTLHLHCWPLTVSRIPSLSKLMS